MEVRNLVRYCKSISALLVAASVLLSLPAFAADARRQTARWMPDHTVIVILENKSYQELIGNPQMPWLNALAKEGAVLTRAYAGMVPYGVTVAGFKHPFPARGSQVNYLTLFSGSNQGFLPESFESPGSPYIATAYQDVYGNPLAEPIENTPVGYSNDPLPMELRPLTTPNLGAAIIAAGKTFATFSELLPYPSYDESTFKPMPKIDGYARRHNPAINWINFSGKQVAVERQRFLLPVSVNLAFDATSDPVDNARYRGFAVDAESKPIGYEQLPTVSLVIPANINNIHSGTKEDADRWMEQHIKPYADWARTHNSMLIITTDEDGSTDASNGSGPYDLVLNDKRKAYYKEHDINDPGEAKYYQYGRDRIPMILFGPAAKVRPGQYGRPVSFNHLLATVLERYGVLDDFRRDFAAAHLNQSDTFRIEEARRQLEDLKPIREVFGER